MANTPPTANYVVRLLSHLYTKACDWDVLPRGFHRPTTTARHLRKQKRARFLTPEERARLEGVLREGEALPPGKDGALVWSNAAAVRLLAMTGMRRGEVLMLTWSMVDKRHQCLHLPDSKTGQKSVPVSSHVLAYLDELKKHRRKGVPWVLHARSGKPIHPVTLTKAWYMIRERAGLPGVRLHDLRHSAASDALMSGVPLEVVGKILGHASIKTTARYAHLSDRVVKAAVESMGNAIAAAQEMAPTVKPKRKPKRKTKRKTKAKKSRKTSKSKGKKA